MIGHRSETRRSIELLRESEKDLSNGKAGGPPPCEAPLSHRSWDKRKATPAAHQGANLMKEKTLRFKMKEDPKPFSWLEYEPLPLPQLREEEETFRVEELSSKRGSPMRVSGSEESDAGSVQN